MDKWKFVLRVLTIKIGLAGYSLPDCGLDRGSAKIIDLIRVIVLWIMLFRLRFIAELIKVLFGQLIVENKFLWVFLSFPFEFFNEVGRRLALTRL